jgi:hypothetical protein
VRYTLNEFVKKGENSRRNKSSANKYKFDLNQLSNLRDLTIFRILSIFLLLLLLLLLIIIINGVHSAS